MNATCGCCTGTEIAVPVSEVNPPGRGELVYRAGTYATFFETMLARLTRIPHLRTRELGDPSIALLDAWAVVADVLTFYQERIVNEGFLPTARERRSVLELAKLIGYRARPGVAASVPLAFTVTKGFRGSLPRGTRAQSIPGSGETPQFFETSEALDVRDTWNVLAPRITRPQTITPFDDGDTPAVTAVNVIDSVYLDGIATNLKPGDALFFIFGNGPGEQWLRLARAVDAQPDDQRTEVTLALEPRPLAYVLPLSIAKATYLFPQSDIAARVLDILRALSDNVGRPTTNAAQQAALVRGALAQLAVQQALSDARGFTRTSAYLRQLTHALEVQLLAWSAMTMDTWPMIPAPALSVTHETLGCSPLARLDAIVGSLAHDPSHQPANALRLTRTVASTFTAHSDAPAQLIAAFNPGAAGALYQAWSGIVTPRQRLRVLAARVRATLFASSFAGAAKVIHTVKGPNGNPEDSSATSFEPPTIATAWTSLAPASAALLALDAVYEHLAVGSWIAIDRLFYPDPPPPPPTPPPTLPPVRRTSFHRVTAANTVAMDTRAGFSGKVTVLTVDPPWLTDAGARTSPEVLRTTVVYAQSEPLTLTGEPLDADVAGDAIDLEAVYDGLEPGRRIIVSGTRTDIPGTSGVTAAEPAMIAGVVQGFRAPMCAPFPFTDPPLSTVHYITAADVNGDRLVVGDVDRAQIERFKHLLRPAVTNQRYCDRARLAPNCYASAYVPTEEEYRGAHPTFAGLLVDPQTGVPFAGGRITPLDTDSAGGATHGTQLFAWRISDEPLHSILELASPLAYKYDRRTVTIYGNVVDATHGQTVGEVLGDGDASKAFQTFALAQSPLTYVSAPTASGTASTLSVRVNDVERHEVRDLASAAPAQRVYATREDDAQSTSVTFGDGVHGARLPTGSSNVKAVYRYGLGKDGNVAAGKISQLATHPLGAQGVINPIAASGGADADRTEDVRVNAPLTVTALDRLVSVRDYADFARTYAGIGKAAAARLSDGLRQVVHVTVAGAGDVPIDVSSDLYGNLVASLLAYGDPHQPVAVDVRRVKLIVMSAAVGLQPDYFWEAVAPKVRAALLARFGFDARELGQTAYLSEAVRVVQDVEGVAFVNVTTFDGVPESVSAADLAALGTTLGLRQYVEAEGARVDLHAAPGAPGRFVPAELAFMTPDVAGTLILTEAAT